MTGHPGVLLSQQGGVRLPIQTRTPGSPYMRTRVRILLSILGVRILVINPFPIFPQPPGEINSPESIQPGRAINSINSINSIKMDQFSQS